MFHDKAQHPEMKQYKTPEGSDDLPRANRQARRAAKRGFTEVEAAVYISMSRSFLRQARADGDRLGRTPGPPWIRIGRSVRYLVDDLDKWVEAHRANSAA